MADAARLRHVAEIITDTYKAGNQVVAVLSAQGDTTDELIEKANEINPLASNREMDMLLSTGEQMSVALCAMAVEALGYPVISLTGWQAGMVTNTVARNARIKKVDTERIETELNQKKIVIVTGFQGINRYEDITTLGRGGSDTSAVALAASLRADLCQIYTDVDGVYTADPRIVKDARKLDEVTYNEMLELATTRPETMLGDTAVAINGDDPRYAHLHGCHVILPLLNKEIPIVCDEHADMTKGTGVVKITPAHDPNDFEVGLRHDLPIVRVFTYDGRMTGAADKAAADALFAAGKNTVNEPHVLDCGKYAGMTTLEARKAILADLKEGGFLKEIEPLKHEVGTCYRCHSTIEPMVSKQWFVKMEPLAKPAIESVEKGDIKFVPERFTKNYMNWMKNTRDWCISRQLWWGHQIPAWYCDDCGETVVAKSAPCTCPKCGGTRLTQDPDTLDTWFSSALWPFSTLGWPNEESEDLKYFYPTNTLVTGYDIIGFWVSRMIFSGLAYTGKAPFDTVCIHGIVRDSQGRKMSKSLGNGIDPLEVIAQYGADALRFMLVDGSTPGNDMRYSEKKVEAARNFANKLWNATRFVLMNLPEDFQPGLPSEEKLDMSDKWVLTKLNQVAGAMSDNLDHYEMGLAAAKINSFIWDVYCDWFIEIAKPRLNSGDAEQADTARRVLVYVLDKALKLLHPFMPFITEELYQALPGSAETIMTQSWPTFDEAHNWADEEEAFEKVMDYIKAVRTMRTEMNVHPAKKTSMIIETADPAPFQSAEVYLAKFAFATDVTFTGKYEGSTDGMVQVSTHAARGFIPMMELIDRDKELARLNKEKAKAEKELAMFENQLNNPKFVERAPAALVEDIRNKHAKSQDKLANIEQSIKALG